MLVLAMFLDVDGDMDVFACWGCFWMLGMFLDLWMLGMFLNVGDVFGPLDAGYVFECWGCFWTFGCWVCV